MHGNKQAGKRAGKTSLKDSLKQSDLEWLRKAVNSESTLQTVLHIVNSSLKATKTLHQDSVATLFDDDAYTRGIAAGMDIALKSKIQELEELKETIEAGIK